MKVLLTFVLALFSASVAHAQIVNTQPLLSKIDAQGFTGDVRLTFDWRTGNTTLLKLTASTILKLRIDQHAFVSSSSIDYGEDEDGLYLMRTFTHLRYQNHLSKLVTWEAYVQAAQDQFRRINFRALTGTGPRWALQNSPRSRVYVGTAYMFEFERYDTEEGTIDPGLERFNHRFSMYLSSNYQPIERITLQGTTFYQPRLDDFSDFIWLTEMQLAVQLVSRLSLTFSLNIAYDSNPPDTIKKLDTTTLTGLTWGF